MKSLNFFTFAAALTVLVCVSNIFGQLPPASPSTPSSPEKKTQPTVDYLQQAAAGSVFIYAGNSRPCDDPAPGQRPLLPNGSGFVVGITNKAVPSVEGTVSAWRILITAGHVVKGRDSIVIRLNRTSHPGFVCVPVPLIREGNNQNVFTLPDEDAADLAGILLPLLTDSDPTIFMPSMLFDRGAMAKNSIKVGTNIFTVGYFYGYAGQKQNYPITKFGKISILTPESWFFNPVWNRFEEAYVVEMQNTPGLSGSPVMTYGWEFDGSPLRYRNLMPLVIGIVKALEIAPVPVGDQAVAISQGVAMVEPATHIKKLINSIADRFRKAGAQVGLD